MRVFVCVVAVLVGGCDDSGAEWDPNWWCGDGYPSPTEECQPSDPYCSDNCTLQYVEVIARWSFETLSGDAKAPCLPGDPAVKVQVSGPWTNAGWKSAACAGGQLSLSVKPTMNSIRVTSVSDHEYSGSVSVPVRGPGDLPIVVIYTDAGNVGIRWSVRDATGFPSTCDLAGIESVRVIVDGVVMKESACSVLGGQGTGLGPILAGTYSLRVDGLDHAHNVIATSSSTDFTILPGAVVEAVVELQL